MGMFNDIALIFMEEFYYTYVLSTLNFTFYRDRAMIKALDNIAHF